MIVWIDIQDKIPENSEKHLVIESYCKDKMMTHMGCGYFKENEFSCCSLDMVAMHGGNWEVVRWAALTGEEQ